MNTKTTEKQETMESRFDKEFDDRGHGVTLNDYGGGPIKDFIRSEIKAAVQKAREEAALAILKDLDKVLYQIIGEENYQISYEDNYALWEKYLPLTQEKCHCLEALSGGKHHEHCMEKSKEPK